MIMIIIIIIQEGGERKKSLSIGPELTSKTQPVYDMYSVLVFIKSFSYNGI